MYIVMLDLGVSDTDKIAVFTYAMHVSQSALVTSTSTIGESWLSEFVK